ncbi:unnamed protein product [Chrysoparadoxa australica]
MVVMRDFMVVVAATAGSLGIGRQGTIPWRLKGDMAFFKNLTITTSHEAKAGTTNAVIMGRKTWVSIPERFRPLVGRRNVVLSRNPRIREELTLPDDVMVAASLGDALEMLASSDMMDKIDRVFVVGGGEVYREAVALPQCSKIYITEVLSDVECDTFFPRYAALLLPHKPTKHASMGNEAKAHFFSLTHLSLHPNVRLPKAFTRAESSEKQVEDGGEYVFATYCREPSKQEGDMKEAAAHAHAPVAGCGVGDEEELSEGNAEEQQYLDAVRDIIENGCKRGDRTGTGTLAKFGVQMRFSLADNRFPLLTTKRVFWRGVAQELLWFVSGCTNANVLKEKGIHIWDGNGSREFLDKLGLTEREEGDLGPVYGFQWRHFGAKYTNMHADYSGEGVDQLAECIHLIKNDPNNRRIILSAWNPVALPEMALPPCHMFCQFFVADGELSCQMYQRSADMGLGVPFNIASYSLLTRMIAQVCGLKAGELVHVIGDAHVYLNHVDALKEQIKRRPRAFPTLEINPDKQDIDAFEYSDLTIQGYSPMSAIKMKMAV